MKANIELFKRVAVVLSIALLSACGGGGTGTPTPTSAPAPATTSTTGTMTFWTKLGAQVPIDLSFDNSPTLSGTVTTPTSIAPVCGSSSASAFTKTFTLGNHAANIVSRTTGSTWGATTGINIQAGCTTMELL